MKDFTYTELSKAEFDLKLFSRMNAYEGRPLFLTCRAEGMTIDTTAPASHLISAIAIDGIMFTPNK